MNRPGLLGAAFGATALLGLGWALRRPKDDDLFQRVEGSTVIPKYWA